MKTIFKTIIAAAFGMFMASAHADPIGGPSCGSCFGTTITMEYEVVSPTNYIIHLFVNTQGYNGPGLLTDWIQAVSVKPANQIDPSSSFVSTTAPGEWAGQLGGLSDGGCNGSGSGFICAQDGTSALTDGSTYEWIFNITLAQNGQWLLGALGAEVKINFDSNSQNNGLLTSEAITLQPYIPTTPVPEPGTLALLGLGMIGLVMVRRRKYS